MEWIIPIVLIVVCYYIIVSIMNFKKEKKARLQLLEVAIKNKYDIAYGQKKNCYDFMIKTENNNYYIKLSFIPSNSCVTINYKDTFVLRYGGQKGHIGRNYPKQRYMNELLGFLNSKYSGQKIILFYESTEQILKYLNESDIGVVNYTDTPYDMKVMNFDDFINHHNEIIK